MAPAESVQAVAEAECHQLVPGGVERHLVDAVAEAVVGAQFRRVPVGLVGEVLHLRRADGAADRVQMRRRPEAAEPFTVSTSARSAPKAS